MSQGAQKNGNVLLVGDVMRDVIVKPDGELRIGSDTKAKIELTAGGSAANQAVWLAANGVNPRLVARVGANDLGDLTRQFEQKGVKPVFVGDNDLTTGILVALISESGERSFFTDRGANKNLCIEDVPGGLLDETAMVLLSGYSFFIPGPRKIATHLMAQAKERNIAVAIDPSSAGFIKDVGVQNFLTWTRGADILFPNGEEAQLLSGKDNPVEQLQVLSEYFDEIVLTLGEQGAMACSKGNELEQMAAHKVLVVDTTGAGDAFFGGYVSARLKGQNVVQCLRQGVAQGARAVTQFGGQP